MEGPYYGMRGQQFYQRPPSSVENPTMATGREFYPSQPPSQQSQTQSQSQTQFSSAGQEAYFGGPYADAPEEAYQDWGNNGRVSEDMAQTEAGVYYPSGHLAPQLFGAPVSAVAYDDAYSAMYVASHTQPFGERPRRASMLVTHSMPDGMLYSSCAGHPEASSSTLLKIYRTFYGGYHDSAMPSAHVPPHAYQPPYGAALAYKPQAAQMGITELLPGHGYVISVSPAGVRVHNQGGLCLGDWTQEGMLCGTMGVTHVSVGGVAVDLDKPQNLHCLDVYQGLRTTSSFSIGQQDQHQHQQAVGVMAMATNHPKQTIVSGCSDGTLRLFDGSWRLRRPEIARMKAHAAGVTDLSVSEDGNLICTTGFGGKSNSASVAPYAFTDPHLLLYDVRYLGRGGIVHPFAGFNVSPRFVSFVPQLENQPPNRFLAASGMNGGGVQIMTPFEVNNDSPGTFIYTQLQLTESISAMCLAGEYVALGTAQSNVLQFQLAGYKELRTTPRLRAEARVFTPDGSQQTETTPRLPPREPVTTTPQKEKRPLEMPHYVPEIPPLSIHPSVLQAKPGGGRNGANDRIRSIFSSYVMGANPTITPVGKAHTFGPIANKTILTSPKRIVSENLMQHAEKNPWDVVGIIPTTKINMNPLERPGSSFPNRGRKKDPILNPNKMIYSEYFGSLCYEWGKSKPRKNAVASKSDDDALDDDGQPIIPERYRLMLRPSYKRTPDFDYADLNDTGIWPGWDYPPSMPSSHAPCVLVLLYFIPEIRSEMLERQFDPRLFSSKSVESVPVLSTELGFLFNYMESVSKNAMIYPEAGVRPRVQVFTPTNFLTAFATMPEAEHLALLDDNPAVAEKARRPEALFLFLLYHVDKEFADNKVSQSSQLVDPLFGLNLVNVNEFITGAGPPEVSSTRTLTVNLAYDPFLKQPEGTRFGEVLRHALCRETRLKAWCKTTRSYENVVQRKIATSLPRVLSLSCACSGRKEEEGLSLWRTSFGSESYWLPEMVELELEGDGNVVVREFVDDRECLTFGGSSSLPAIISDLVIGNQNDPNRKYRYRLEAILSFVRDDLAGDRVGGNDPSRHANGHHVLHMRIPKSGKERALRVQQEQTRLLLESLQNSPKTGSKLTLTADLEPSLVARRLEKLNEIERRCEEDSAADDWVLFNGFVVSRTTAQDARNFHSTYKEPCIVVYRIIDEKEGEGDAKDSSEAETKPGKESVIPSNVMFSRSISTSRASKYALRSPSDLPGEGDLLALDSEYVCVQEEEAILNDKGNKVTTREARPALARVSVLDCRSGNIIIDDHVLPREPVVDYLTRFSGILAGDLDPKTSPHHLVTPRTAYLKLRCLMERGCVFVGHGLSQDFLIVNLHVPPSQVIDTVMLYHKDNKRSISLRYLANYVLKRDMQQDIHDSVEDAKAAYELYLHATKLKMEGTFERFLDDLYEHGTRTDWRIGADHG